VKINEGQHMAPVAVVSWTIIFCNDETKL